MKLSTKKNKIIFGGAAAILLLSATVFGVWYNAEASKPKWDVRGITLKIEYGETYDPLLVDFVNEDTYKEVQEKELNLEVKLDIPNEEGKDYPTVGEYKGVVKDDKTLKEIAVKVEDTTAPKIEGVGSIDIVQNTNLEEYNFEELFTVTDLSEFEVSFDKKEIDITAVGTYTLKVVAKDIYDNEESKKITVNVIEEPKEDEELVTEVVTNTDGTTSKKTTTVKKPTNTTPSSNNSNTTTSNSGSNNSSGSKPSGGSSGSSGSNTGSSSGSGSTGGSSGGGNTGGSTNPPTATSCTNNNNHSVPVGNIGKWVGSRNDVKNIWFTTVEAWDKKYDDGKGMSYEEYVAGCKYSYEAWSCGSCGKWTGNLK